MNWEYILKNKNLKDDKGPIGPKGMGGVFSLDMFNRSNWVKALDELLSFNIKDEELGNVGSLDKVTGDAIAYASEYYVDLLNTMLSYTDYGEEVEQASKDYAESTTAFAGEKEVSEPKGGEKGLGMIPKRLEYITGAISKSIESNIEKLIRDIHDKVDKFHAKGGEMEESEEQTDLSQGLTDEMIDKAWTNLTAGNYHGKLLQEGANEISEVFNSANLNISSSDMKNVAMEMKDKESTKMFLTHVWTILMAKILSGMAARSPKQLERQLEDFLSPEEIKWMEDNAKGISVNLGPMGSVEGRDYPKLDRFGIPNIKQVDPETGQEYFVPRDIGELSDTDFDPTDESEDKPAPEVKEYDRGRMRTPAEWRQWQEKNAAALNTDSFERAWDTLKE